MRQIVEWGYFVPVVALVGLLGVAGSTRAQFGGHPEENKVNVSSYPAEIQSDYKVFINKCSECHSLARTLNQSRSAKGWTEEVQKMRAMASSHIDTREADQIANFLVYDESHRKASAREAITSSVNGSPGKTGKQLFQSYGCSACHSVGGDGDKMVALNGIGNKKSAEELKKLISSPLPGGAMPKMDIPDKDLNNLVAYLLTLKDR